MANEITFQGILRFAKGGVDEQLSFTSQSNAAGENVFKATVDVANTNEQISLGELANVGYIAVQNLSANRSVQVGAANGEYTVNLAPGGYAVYPAAGNELHAVANAGTAKLFVFATEK